MTIKRTELLVAFPRILREFQGTWTHTQEGWLCTNGGHTILVQHDAVHALRPGWSGAIKPFTVTVRDAEGMGGFPDWSSHCSQCGEPFNKQRKRLLSGVCGDCRVKQEGIDHRIAEVEREVPEHAWATPSDEWP